MVTAGPPELGERRVRVDDLTRLRFAVSPLWEAVASLRVLRSESPPALHAAWAGRTRARVARRRLRFPVLEALVPARGHLADFLTPTPASRTNDFADELAAVGRVEPDIIRRDLDVLRAASPGSAARRILGTADPGALRDAATAELARYWEQVLAPGWPRLAALAEADLGHRLQQMATGGAHRVAATLHPRVRMAGSDLVVEKSCRPGPVAAGRGLVLVPCAFAWPDVLFFDVPGHAPTLSYAPRGVGTLWDAPAGRPPDEALAELVGRTRAAALRTLDLPLTTTQLAAHLAVTAPTMSQHLRVLAGTGLVASRRRGREVLYARTPLGDALAAGGTNPPSGGR